MLQRLDDWTIQPSISGITLLHQADQFFLQRGKIGDLLFNQRQLAGC